jgi:hypothetical protein
MIISHGRGYIFVHIPKTGGTSLSLALEARAMKDDILIGDTPKAINRRARVKDMSAAGRLWKHSNLSDVHGVVSEEQMGRYFVFTLVRNPWDRLASYYHWLREQKFQHDAVGLAKSVSFSKFLHDPSTKIAVKSNHYASYVTDSSGAEHCNLFIRLENLTEDLLPLERHLGFSLGTVGRENASNRNPDYRSYYAARDVDLVADLCAVDIARFGYQY